MFAGLAKQNYYWKDKLNLFIALAPVTKLDYATSTFIQYTAKYSRNFFTVRRGKSLGPHRIMLPLACSPTCSVRHAQQMNI